MKNLFNSILSTQPAVMEWVINVQSTQPFGQYDMIVNDGNKSFVLGIGAVLCGPNPVPKGKWREVFDSIGAGSVLNVRVRSGELAEAKTSAVTILRLNSVSYAGAQG